MKALGDREYGFEFSGTEYTIVFNSDNMGFVRYDGRSRQRFFLTPHPVVSKDPREGIYILDADCPEPQPKKLIRILSMDSIVDKKAPTNKKSLYYEEKVINYVHSWEEVDPNKVFKRRNLYYEEYVNFFSEGFVAAVPDAQIESISHSMAIYTASSPVIGSNEKGGINTAIRYGKYTKLWRNFKSMLEIVPNELKKTDSQFFYKYGEREQIINPLASSEVNLAYPDPEQLIAQIPITLVKMDVNNSDSYKEYANDIMPFIRAYELDALLFTPDMSAKADKLMQEAIYELKEVVNQNEFMSYTQDMGMALPKISASLARLHFNTEIKKDHIKEAFNTWLEAYQESFFWETRAASPEDLIKVRRLGSDAKKLYFHLLEKYSVDELIPKTALYEKGPLSEFYLEEAIESLLKNGAIYYPDLNHFKILEINKDVWQR